MENFILQSTLISGVFFLLYRMVFSRTSFFRLNRTVLLSIPFISIAVPLLAPLFNRPEALTLLPAIQLPELQLNGQAAQIGSSDSFNWLFLAYMAGATLMFLFFVIGLFRCYKTISDSRYLYDEIYASPKATGPFAFIDKIVIPEKLLSSDKLEAIIIHEKAHVEQGHSFDKFFYNLYTMLFWFNPFAHLLSRELLTVHECLADEKVVQNSSTENYARLLLSTAMGSEINLTGATPFFNSSLIKTRITMMYKAKTNRKMKGLYLAMLPLLAVMMIISCQKEEDPIANQAAVEKSKNFMSSSVEMGLDEADQPPLFEHCDANAVKEDQILCFQQGLMEHIVKNFEYPERAHQEKLEGKIYVSFIIDKSGRVKGVETPKANFNNDGKDISHKTMEEAMNTARQLLKALPQLSPAVKDGKEVSVSFVVPIQLKLG